MKKSLNFKKTVSSSSLNTLIEDVTKELAKEGFGVLTRIDFHEKMKEKLGKTLPPLVILGACHPQSAFEAFQVAPDVTALMPCNAVIRETGSHQYSVELAKPSFMLETLEMGAALEPVACELDDKMKRVLQNLG